MKRPLSSIVLPLCAIGPGVMAWSCAGTTLRIGPAWQEFGKNPLHTAVSDVRSQLLRNIHWTAMVDTVPPAPDEYAHYGSPVATLHGTILVPTRTTTTGFEIRAYNEEVNPPAPAPMHPLEAEPFWSFGTDYVLPPDAPPSTWLPCCGIALRKKGSWGPLSLAVPGAGGTVLLIDDPDNQVSPVTATQLAFYGPLTDYTSNRASLDATVMIDTPITVDSAGNLYFGFVATGAPLGLKSGVARISAATDTGIWVSAAAAADDPLINKVPYNCAPALSRDGQFLYVAVSDQRLDRFYAGYLLKLRAADLVAVAKVRLEDVLHPGEDAVLFDDSTASPVVGPDGDVYFGVFEPHFDHHGRGWLLHFDADLSQTKLPGAFGWDTTPSIVSAGLVPSYSGPSAYLLLTKYNDYVGAGGTGVHQLAILDPSSPMIEASSGATVMNEVRTIAGPTPDPDHTATHPGAVKEWCINTVAIDPYPIVGGGFSFPSPGLLPYRPRGYGGSALVNNEDGRLYRWVFDPNVLMSPVKLTDGLEEAYTPTLVGPHGTVFAINDRVLFAVGE